MNNDEHYSTEDKENENQNEDQFGREFLNTVLLGGDMCKTLGFEKKDTLKIFDYAKEQFYGKQYKNALTFAAITCFLDTSFAEAWILVGRSASLCDAHHIALDAFLNAISINGETPYLCYSYGIAALASGLVEDGKANILRALDLLSYPADNPPDLVKAIQKAAKDVEKIVLY